MNNSTTTIKERKEITINCKTKGEVHAVKREMIKDGFHTGEQEVYFNYSSGEWQLTMYTDFKPKGKSDEIHNK